MLIKNKLLWLALKTFLFNKRLYFVKNFEHTQILNFNLAFQVGISLN